MSTHSLLFPEMAPPPTFDFPEPLADKYKPRRIADFAGLPEVKKTLAGFVQRPSDRGFLFCGPAGTGKTSMGFALASELGAFPHHIRAQKCTVDEVERTAFSCHYYPPTGYTRHAVICDEADLMSFAAQNALLSYLDGTNTIADTVWIFSCNAEFDKDGRVVSDRLERRFVTRCRVVRFGTYGVQDEAADLLSKIWTAETNGAPSLNFAALIKTCRGNIREALAVLENKIDAL